MKTLSKVLGGLVITGTILSAGAMAMAADANGTNDKHKDFKNRPAMCDKMNKFGDKGNGFLGKDMMKNNMENELKTLVSSGVITQDESDKILALSKQEAETRKAEMDKVKNMSEDERKAYFDSMKDKKPEMREDIFTKAVSSNILTQEKVDAIKAKLKETHDAERTAKFTESLNQIVTAGTITQEQADKVMAYMKTMEANRPAPDAKKEDMKDKEKKNPLTKLVEDGTLTQDQLDAICKAMPMGGNHGGHRGFDMDKMGKSSVEINK